MASFIYDYIEKDLRIKLCPSSNQLDDGYLFWKNRLKRKNPKDEEFLKKLKIIKRRFYEDESGLRYYIYNNEDDCLGYAEILDGSDYINYIKIRDEKNKRKGVATFVYDYIEKDLRIKLKPSPAQLLPGQEFWKNRLKK